MSADVNADGGGSIWSMALRSPRRVLGGGAAFLFALSLLITNETSAKRNADALLQAKKEIVTVDAAQLSGANEGKLVAAEGTLKSSKGVIDPDFDVESKAVALKRHVLMYQWIEYTHTEGSGRRKRTVYEYEQGWSDIYQNSNTFHQPDGHKNPEMGTRSRVIMAGDAALGAYKLDDAELFNQALPGDDDEGSEYIEDSIATSDISQLAHPIGNLRELPSGMQNRGWVKISDSIYYKPARGEVNAEPQLGDLAVNFVEIPIGAELTLIGKQQGNRIAPWKADSGQIFYVARSGHSDIGKLINDEIKSQSGHLSAGRIGGLLMTTLGFAAFAAGLGGALLNVPVLGRVLGMGLWIGGAIIGFLSGATAIVIGWLSARPIVAFLLVGSIVALASWRTMVSNKKNQAAMREKNIIQAAAVAKQRHFERQNAGTPPPPPPGSAPLPSAMPPPITAKAGGSALSPQAFSVPQVAVPDALSNGDLPPLEWTPSGSFKPPEVVKKANQSAHQNTGKTPSPLTAEQAAAPTPVKPKAKRVELAEKNGYVVSKIVYIDGPKEGEVVCFELLRGKEVMARGTQEEVKTALKGFLQFGQ